MAFIPYEKYDLVTQLNPNEIMERLHLNVAPRRFGLFTNRQTECAYEGWALAGRFQMSRIINYRNSFNPQIKGIIIPGENGCKISIVLKPDSGIVAFLYIFIAFILFAAVGMAVSQIENAEFKPASLIILVFFAFIYLLSTGGFNMESKDAKRFLKEMFEAQEV